MANRNLGEKAYTKGERRGKKGEKISTLKQCRGGRGESPAKKGVQMSRGTMPLPPDPAAGILQAVGEAICLKGREILVELQKVLGQRRHQVIKTQPI